MTKDQIETMEFLSALVVCTVYNRYRDDGLQTLEEWPEGKHHPFRVFAIDETGDGFGLMHRLEENLVGVIERYLEMGSNGVGEIGWVHIPKFGKSRAEKDVYYLEFPILEQKAA